MGSSTVIVSGICWSTVATPTLADNRTINGGKSGNFSSNLTGLNGKTSYNVRAYATNSVGTGYGNELTFNTLETITDIDSNVYNIVTFGTQVWMAENLRTTKLNDGTLITNLPFNETWSGITGPGYWSSRGCTFYNGYSANTGKLCPIGWHVPTCS
jgi:hypothetical protein